ncbi:hypothetical protein D3C81_1993530 [compost metagenome]
MARALKTPATPRTVTMSQTGIGKASTPRHSAVPATDHRHSRCALWARARMARIAPSK